MSSGLVSRCAALSWARGRVITPQRLWPVLRARGGVEPLLASAEDELAEEFKSQDLARAVLRGPHDSEALRWAAGIERTGIRILTAFDAEYPRALAEIADPPFLLYAIGRVDRLRLPAVAIVGSRDASRYGRDVAWKLSRELSAAGVAVVSGFARGVDAAAHEAALEGPGGTIAVLGCGVDVDYPREHRGLKDRLASDHLLLSESPPGTEPRPQNFPIRNRIIAGLSAGVVVVEASRRSGSLITARLANDFGRDVFAVPGSVFSPTSVGVHELLRDGAILCRGSEDVLAELFPSIGSPAFSTSSFRQPTLGALGPLADAAFSRSEASARAAAEISPEARRIFDALCREEGLSAEDLARALDLPAATVLAGLFELEGAGFAVPSAGGRYGAVRR